MFKTKLRAKKAIITTKTKRKERHHFVVKDKKTGEKKILWFQTPPKQAGTK